METRFKFRHVNELTGLLVLGVLALVLAGIVFSAHSQRWFARRYSFDVRLPEEGALGLRRGADVFILGVSVGLVEDISVGDDGRMTAGVEIRRDFRTVRARRFDCVHKKGFRCCGRFVRGNNTRHRGGTAFAEAGDRLSGLGRFAWKNGEYARRFAFRINASGEESRRGSG